jgi:toxin FitB
LNVVDSSGWLEYFSGGPRAGRFLPPLQDPEALVVPSITIFEVFKVVLREAGENAAWQAVTAMQKGKVVELTDNLAVSAAKLSLEIGLPMADSIILATARAYGARIWTQDSDFADIPGVNYFPRN